MARITITVDQPITGGELIKFYSPCDSDESQGLTITYGSLSENYTLCDEMGNNLGGVPHLFKQDSVVHVVVDLESHKAYLQGANYDLAVSARDYTSSGEIDHIKIDGTGYVIKDSVARNSISGVQEDIDDIEAVIPSSATSSNKLADSASVTAVSNSVSTINSKIPSTASSSNQLADKSFVNSSIGTNTAYYISNSGQPFTSLAQLQAYSGTVTNNDYAFVTVVESGNTYYDRYKASVNGTTITWSKEYRLNNSSFTDAQWNAMNSGITSELVEEIISGTSTSHVHSNMSVLNEITSSKISAWDAKYSKPSSGIPKSDLASEVQTSLGRADSALQSHQDISGKENTSNKVTSWSSTTTDAHYPSEKLVKTSLDGKANSSHTHDDRYYTESEIDTKLSGKANSSHTHTKSQITDFPTSMPASDVYSWAKASAKPSYSWSEIGSKPSTFTPSSHNHGVGDITSGTLAVARGGTGKTSLGDTAYTSLNFRGMRFSTSDTNPSENGTICWTYS